MGTLDISFSKGLEESECTQRIDTISYWLEMTRGENFCSVQTRLIGSSSNCESHSRHSLLLFSQCEKKHPKIQRKLERCVLPSTCLMKTWLPFCLTGTKPILANASMISFPDKTESFSDNDGYQLVAFLPSLRLVFFKEEFNSLSQISEGFFLGLALTDSFRQLDASGCVVAGFLILPETNRKGTLNHLNQYTTCHANHI